MKFPGGRVPQKARALLFWHWLNESSVACSILSSNDSSPFDSYERLWERFGFSHMLRSFDLLLLKPVSTRRIKM